MAQVLLKHVAKHFDKNTIVPDLSLSVEDREFLVLVGPSGCGKSTVLRMIAGLEDVTAGEVWIDGRTVNQVAPKDRDIAMVFQNYALYPHMNVWDNMAFGLKMRKTPKSVIAKRVNEAAKILDLEALLKRKPKQLSGGQRQRVALGRAIVRDPKVFLMDEPLSNLDAKLRVQMRAEIIRLHRRLNATTIYVTHDQVEAMTMGDRIAVLNQGVLQQLDTPLTIYQRPANRFVASFMGQINFIPVRKNGDSFELAPLQGNPVALPAAACPASCGTAGGLILGFRPEQGGIATKETLLPSITLSVVPTLYETLGSETWIHADWQGQSLLFRVPADARLGELNQPLPVQIDLSRACWFDSETGVAL